MKKIKKFWAFLGVIGLGFITFTTFNGVADIILKDSKQLITLFLSLSVVMIYGISNRKEIFK